MQHEIDGAANRQPVGDITVDEPEPRVRRQVRDVGPRPGDQVVEAQHLRPTVQEALTQVGSEEAGAAGHHGTPEHPRRPGRACRALREVVHIHHQGSVSTGSRGTSETSEISEAFENCRLAGTPPHVNQRRPARPGRRGSRPIGAAGLTPIARPSGDRWKNDATRRSIGVSMLAASLVYVGWIAVDMTAVGLWLSIPFLLANASLVCLLFINVFNNWHRMPAAVAAPAPYDEPVTAVIVPTYNEPAGMVRRTLESVLEQNWPREKLVVVVGDDGRRDAVRDMLGELRAAYPSAVLHYHLPPAKRTPERKGDAKDGNLNSMFDFVVHAYPAVQFIETRDADDLVGDPDFLRHTVGLLLRRPAVAFVQTIKDSVVSRGDPFGNRRRFFYRGIMLSRASYESAFPCGSGLVWRRAHLREIGGFPTWNLVEDLYSGYVALRHGLRGAYLPIAGAVGQVAPEDIPNVYKQLGTWALDTLRLLVWRSPVTARTLSPRQRLQFLEMGLFYLSSVPTLVLILTPALCLLRDVRMFHTGAAAHIGYSTFYISLLACYMFVLGNGTSWREVWRAKQMWVGMSFVYINAFARAVAYGPRRKPRYRVTRKVPRAGVYLRHVAPQIALVAFLAAVLIRHVAAKFPDLGAIDLGSTFWVLSYGTLLLGFIRLSWYDAARAGDQVDPIEPIDPIGPVEQGGASDAGPDRSRTSDHTGGDRALQPADSPRP